MFRATRDLGRKLIYIYDIYLRIKCTDNTVFNVFRRVIIPSWKLMIIVLIHFNMCSMCM